MVHSAASLRSVLLLYVPGGQLKEVGDGVDGGQ